MAYSGESEVSSIINGTNSFLTLNSSHEYEPPPFDPCKNFEDKVARLSDSFHSYMRPLAISLYSIVASLGAGGNFLVILSVICNPQMRVPRNYFIISLASSDLLMCTITVPFTMYNTFNTFWNLGEITCRSVSALQGVNLFVSTMSITAIGGSYCRNCSIRRKHV
uniref:G-protein coupled receptors family 1 profile domain-containing protein n=1 Tax=Romanomermis culicivorax TaxID=13658 RepID=A0A915J1G8_ROMCU